MEKKLKQKKKKNWRKKEKEILNEKIKIEEKCLENQSYWRKKEETILK